MRKYLCYLCLVVWLGTSCTKSNELTIPEEKLVDVLVDMHISEGAAQNLIQPMKDSILGVYYEQIFEMHQVSESEFKADIMVLSADVKLSKQVYEKVLDEITRKESKGK